jgi:hypothetical protein
VRVGLAALLTAIVVVLAATADAGTARRTCPGAVDFSRTETVVVVLRGVSCSEAKRVALAYGRFRSTAPWFCALAHAPFDRIDGRIVGFSCGRGGSRGDLRRWPHAFVGTVER